MVAIGGGFLCGFTCGGGSFLARVEFNAGGLCGFFSSGNGFTVASVVVVHCWGSVRLLGWILLIFYG